MSRAFQKSINRMSRVYLGVLPSTPVAFLQTEGGSVPATARLDRRQESFAIRLASATSGPHTGLLRATSGLGHRISEMVPEVREQEIEDSRPSLGRSFPGVVDIMPVWRGEEREEGIRMAIKEATEKEKGPNTIWADGSRLDDRRVGVGVAWYEKVTEEEEGKRIFFSRRDFRTAGQRRETSRGTYNGRYRSIGKSGSGWRSAGFGMGGGHEAYDAELAALAYGLVTRQGRYWTGLLGLYRLQGSYGEDLRRRPGSRTGDGSTSHRVSTADYRLGKLHHDQVDTGTQGSGRKRDGRQGGEGGGIPPTPPGHTSTLQSGLPQKKGHRADHPEMEKRHRGEEHRTKRLSARPRPGIRPQLRGAPKSIAADD